MYRPVHSRRNTAVAVLALASTAVPERAETVRFFNGCFRLSTAEVYSQAAPQRVAVFSFHRRRIERRFLSR